MNNNNGKTHARKTLREVDCLPSTTFRPLSGGRLSCNKTGQVLACPARSKGFRRLMNGKEHPRMRIPETILEPVRAVRSTMSRYPTAQIDRDGDVKCPHCFGWNMHVVPGQQLCGAAFCRQIFVAVPCGSQRITVDAKPVKYANVVDVAYLNCLDEVNCPHCGLTHIDMPSGMIRCRSCGREFRAIY